MQARFLAVKLRLFTEQKTHLMSFDDVFQFPEQFWLYIRTQVDDWPCQAVVLKQRNAANVLMGEIKTLTSRYSNRQENIH